MAAASSWRMAHLIPNADTAFIKAGCGSPGASEAESLALEACPEPVEELGIPDTLNLQSIRMNPENPIR